MPDLWKTRRAPWVRKTDLETMPPHPFKTLGRGLFTSPVCRSNSNLRLELPLVQIGILLVEKRPLPSNDKSSIQDLKLSQILLYLLIEARHCISLLQLLSCLLWCN